jgi:hypothetical protein
MRIQKNKSLVCMHQPPRKQETVERLRAAIASLKEKKQDITAQTIYSGTQKF